MTDGTEKTVKAPWAWRVRSSPWYITFVVALGGFVDLAVYALPISFVPFRLQELGYNNVSSKTGWLLFAFSLSLVLSTPLISWWSEKYQSRRTPLVVGLLALIGAQVLFMESTKLWTMLLARVLQGISSTVVWVVALALLCDTVAPERIGRHMGVTMTGYSCGLIVATPLGGLLYGRLGYRAPFIFGIIISLVDLAARLLVIEKTEADLIRIAVAIERVDNVNAEADEANHVCRQIVNNTEGTTPRLPAWKIWRELGLSRRSLAVFVLTFAFGAIMTITEPTAPLRLENVWHLKPTTVGLVFLATCAPSLVSGPLAGWLADRYSAPAVAAGGVLLAAPWLYPLTLDGDLAIFIVALSFAMFFESSLVTPITVETAMLTSAIPGVGYADTFGVFNIAYGIGSAVGPIIGGQLYDRYSNGWILICGVLGALLGLGLLSTTMLGEVPFAVRLWRRPGQEPRRSDETRNQEKFAPAQVPVLTQRPT